MSVDNHKNTEFGGLAALINLRLAAEARVAKAKAFGWLCGGSAICVVLYWPRFCSSFMLSVKPGAEQTVKAQVEVFERAELKTTVSGVVSLSRAAELRLASGQTIKLDEGATVGLDPNASVRIVGDLKILQPSKQQLQIDNRSENDVLPFTSYTIFKTVNYGSGVVETGWAYDLSYTARPKYQYCQYRQALDKGVFGKVSLAVNGYPRRPSNLTKLSFNFDGACECIWFSGM
jgi:hypothetical protein